MQGTSEAFATNDAAPNILGIPVVNQGRLVLGLLILKLMPTSSEIVY